MTVPSKGPQARRFGTFDRFRRPRSPPSIEASAATGRPAAAA